MLVCEVVGVENFQPLQELNRSRGSIRSIGSKS